MMKLLKAGCLLIYASALAGWAGLLPAGLTSIMQNTAIAFLLIHALEAVLAFKHVRLYQGSVVISILLTLLFGLLHWKPLANAKAASQANSRPD